MQPRRAMADGRSMAETQGATPPAWLGRSRWRLLARRHRRLSARTGTSCVQLLSLLVAYLRPRLVRRRLERLRALGHIDATPTIAQLLVAGRDQMMVSAAEETKIFYRSQGIPWVFHNLRRFLSGPATMLDPIGLFSPRDAIVAARAADVSPPPALRPGAAARARGRRRGDGARRRGRSSRARTRTSARWRR